MNSGRSMVWNMSSSSRPLAVALVAVELHLAERQRADDLAVLLAVADVHHGLVRLGVMRGMDRRELAEAPRKAHLLILGQRLRAQQDHLMLMPRSFDFLEYLIRDRLRRIHAADFRTEGR